MRVEQKMHKHENGIRSDEKSSILGAQHTQRMYPKMTLIPIRKFIHFIRSTTKHSVLPCHVQFHGSPFTFVCNFGVIRRDSNSIVNFAQLEVA